MSIKVLTSFSEAAHCVFAAQGAFWAEEAAGAASAAKSADADANIAAIDIISLFSIVFSWVLSLSLGLKTFKNRDFRKFVKRNRGPDRKMRGPRKR